MGNYLLFVVLNLGYGQKQVLFQEFSTQERCNSALVEVSKLGKDTIERVVCLPK